MQRASVSGSANCHEHVDDRRRHREDGGMKEANALNEGRRTTNEAVLVDSSG